MSNAAKAIDAPPDSSDTASRLASGGARGRPCSRWTSSDRRRPRNSQRSAGQIDVESAPTHSQPQREAVVELRDRGREHLDRRRAQAEQEPHHERCDEQQLHDHAGERSPASAHGARRLRERWEGRRRVSTDSDERAGREMSPTARSASVSGGLTAQTEHGRACRRGENERSKTPTRDLVPCRSCRTAAACNALVWAREGADSRRCVTDGPASLVDLTARICSSTFARCRVRPRGILRLRRSAQGGATPATRSTRPRSTDAAASSGSFSRTSLLPPPWVSRAVLPLRRSAATGVAP